ncbi:MAG: excinuclease ABC subunit UvrC [Candidatus Berkiella sp.]
MFDYKTFLNTVPTRPGVYCMKDTEGKVLYVGKAKDLKKRLSSYFHRDLPEIKTQRLVEKIFKIELTVTASEKEALLLETSLIKSLKPRYNVIFRDDKSYPYLFVSKHEYPRLIYCRGKQKEKGTFFGPYPSALAVKETLNLLQKTFQVRQCDDLFFKSRSRPCLQYQIKRCSAPCVGYIESHTYNEEVKKLELFLTGKNNEMIQKFVEEMVAASNNLEFEKAASIRDQIISLRTVFDQQNIYGGTQNLDVCAIVGEHGQACIHYLLIREGRILASQSYFTKQFDNLTLSDILRMFILQGYINQENKNWPNEIVTNEIMDDVALIAETLTQFAKRTIQISVAKRGDKLNWLKLAVENAKTNLHRRLNQSNLYIKRFESLKELLGLEECKRMECFDISHTQGVETRASCVVFNQDGPDKSAYRIYQIESATNDDYQSMVEVLTRRYLKLKEKNAPLPDLVIIDGGKGQLNCARQVFAECQITGVKLLAIAKGEKRKPGLETLFILEGEEIAEVNLVPHHPALHILQQIRDEAHRFAISKHRQARAKKSQSSVLDDIPGIGEKRKLNLIQYFGGLQELLAASEEAIRRVPGMSASLAAAVYQALHPK